MTDLAEQQRQALKEASESQAVEALRERDERHWHLTDQLAQTERRNRVLSLIRNGATAEQAAELLRRGDANNPPLEIAASTITHMVKQYLDAVHREDALTLEQMRVLENQRLDQLWARLNSQLFDGDGNVNLKVVDRLTRLSERRSKMNGMDAAQRHEHFLGDGLAALGLEQDHLDRARQAFVDTFTSQGIPDVEVVDADVIAEIERA